MKITNGTAKLTRWRETVAPAAVLADQARDADAVLAA
jgi:hypothetical protein